MSPITTFILGLLIGVIVWWIIDSAFWRPSDEELLAARESQDRMRAAEVEATRLKAALHKEAIGRQTADMQVKALQSALHMTESAQMTAVTELEALREQTDAAQESATDVYTSKLKTQLHKALVARESAEARIAGLRSALQMTESAQMTAVTELEALHTETTLRNQKAAATAAAAKPAPAVTMAAKQAKPDDLTVVEGIGPKIDGVLKSAGIDTLQALAATAIPRLKKILAAAGGRYRLADPATWPDQARLASTGEWDALETLQGELKGGRQQG